MPSRKRKKIRDGILFTIGYILSPLSFWNDLFVNIPIAYVFGLMFGLISSDLFLAGLIIGYWLSNIAGFILMHFGAKDLISKGETVYTKKNLLKDLLISIGYTFILILLVYLGLLKFPFPTQ